MDEMQRDYERYMAEKRLCDDVARSIEALLVETTRVSEVEALCKARDVARKRSDHIVAVWN